MNSPINHYRQSARDALLNADNNLEITHGEVVDGDIDATLAALTAAAVELVEQSQIETIANLQSLYEKKKQEKITKAGRPAWARQNETLEDSYSRRQGFLSGLLVAIDALRQSQRKQVEEDTE